MEFCLGKSESSESSESWQIQDSKILQHFVFFNPWVGMREHTIRNFGQKGDEFWDQFTVPLGSFGMSWAVESTFNYSKLRRLCGHEFQARGFFECPLTSRGAISEHVASHFELKVDIQKWRIYARPEGVWCRNVSMFSPQAAGILLPSGSYVMHFVTYQNHLNDLNAWIIPPPKRVKRKGMASSEPKTSFKMWKMSANLQNPRCPQGMGI